jgi:hypothetical protein
LPACDSFALYDCRAVILERLDDTRGAADAFGLFIETELVWFAEGSGEEIDGRFIVGFAHSFLLKRATTVDGVRFGETIVRSLTTPLFALTRSTDVSRVKIVIALVHELCTMLEKGLPFDRLLQLAVVEWQELPFGFLRSALLAIVNDFEYDVDQKLSMVLLYHADEVELNVRYLSSWMSGTPLRGMECGGCGGPLFGVNCEIRVFECGHAFHKTEACLGKAVCPVCNPEERLGQNVEGPIQSIPKSRFRRELTRFERLLDGRARQRPCEQEKRGDVAISRVAVFPLS